MNTPDFALPFSGGFFNSYLVDHFAYKQEALLFLHDHFQDLKTQLQEGMPDINEEQFLRTLRVEIRSNYFQAIETLFELIFALEPRGSVIDNRNLMYLLSTSDWRGNYDRILRIAGGDLAFLDRIVTAGPRVSVSFNQYLFFFGIVDNMMTQAIDASLLTIRKFLIAFASEFANRDEYNAIKHSMRLVHLMEEFGFGPKGSTVRIKRDLKDSMSYMKQEKDSSLTMYTKPLDTVRDFKMTIVCSNLISNIFRSRKYHFTKDQSIELHTLTDESYVDATKRNLSWSALKLNFKQVPLSDEARGDETDAAT
jgi:hypothetical protein